MAKPTRSLIGRTLSRMALRIGAVVAVVSLVSYWHVREALETQALQQLATYVEERRARESEVFLLAGDHLRLFVERFLDEYRSSLTELPDAAVTERFDALFEQRADGSVRVRASAFHRDGITGYIGPYTEVDADLRRRLVIAAELLARFGPAWRSRFVNLYVITPEHAILMYWPDEPWALNAGDWEINGKLALVSPADGVVVVGDPPDSGPGERAWSNLYFDYGVNDWLVSATEPAVLAGRRLLSAGHDLLLQELLERAVSSGVAGTYNLIFSDDGRVIAHPRLMEAIQANGGALTIAATGDGHLQRVFERARGVRDQQIVHNEVDDEYLAITPLPGPAWSLVTVFPRSTIAEQAWATARIVLVLGAAALLVEIGILYAALKNQVARPLHALLRATRQLASGRLEGAIAVERDDEIGELARSFNRMADEIEAREQALSERSATLTRLNERLAWELAERQRMEAVMTRQREALHESEKIKALGSLLSGIAHELNNPLSVVVGRAVLLEEKLRGSSHGPAAEKLRMAAERCTRIVKSFLAMARQQAPVRQPVRLTEVVDAALDLVASRLRGSSVVVDVALPADLPQVIGDAGQLGQVFGNLFVNAQQAMAEHPGERRVRVTAEVDRDRELAVITFADTGPGVPPGIRHRIFEPFFTTKPPGVGTGMGLSVCYRIIEVHGGTMRVETAEGGGAAFVITLPLAPAERVAPAPATGQDAAWAGSAGR